MFVSDVNIPGTTAQSFVYAVWVGLVAVGLGACGGSASSGGSPDVGQDGAADVLLDTSMADTSDALGDLDTLEAPSDSDLGDVSDGALLDTAVSNDTMEDTAPDVPDDVPGDVSEDVSEDISEDIFEDVIEDISEDVFEDTIEDVIEDISEDVSEDMPPPGPVSIRIMAANTSSGNFQSYDLGHGIRIFQGLTPDITLIQEFNYGNNSERDIRTFIDLAFGESFVYVREPDSDIPNGVVSRWPIVASGVWEDDEAPNREFVWARIDIPGPIDVWAVSVHLLTRNATTRNLEATQLIETIEDQVPEGDYLVVGGDLNTDNNQEEALVTLNRAVSLRHTPVDRNGNPNTNASRAKPYDWVLPDVDLNAHHVPVRIGEQSFPDGLVFDSRVFTPLELVAPVELGDSDAPQMQHMAVVKQFLVPVGP
ncbi:MAG: endonuclease/exonuclease/phosphatase family protein [Myxococcota bacterium]